MVTALNCDLDGLTDEAGRQVECSRPSNSGLDI